MSQIKYKTIDFNEMFELKRGQIISKEYINIHKGEYPVYSTQVEEAFGYIDSYMYDGKYLIWNTDGLAGYIKIMDGKFSITNIVGIMFLKEPFTLETISLEYIKYILEPIFRSNKKGRMGENGKNEYTKLNSTMIKNLNIKIPMPVKEDGTFDMEVQQELTAKYELIKNKKQKLFDKKKEIEIINIDFYHSVATKEVPIVSICDICKSDKSITKAKIQAMKGDIPVYSATVGKPLGFVNFYNNDKPALLVVNDGDSGRTYIVKDEKYTIGKHVMGLKIKDKYKDQISLEFLQIIAEPLFLKQAKGNGLKNLPGVMVKETTVLIPVKPDGNFDINTQLDIAKKYLKVEQIKKSLSLKMNSLLELNINI